jgi:hypothetical protein
MIIYAIVSLSNAEQQQTDRREQKFYREHTRSMSAHS